MNDLVISHRFDPSLRDSVMVASHGARAVRTDDHHINRRWADSVGVAIRRWAAISVPEAVVEGSR